MVSRSRIFALLEEALTTEKPLEALCGDCPELLPELRRRVDLCRDLDGRLDEMFPTFAAPRPPGRSTPSVPEIEGYTIQSVLGRGGIGIVYRAHHAKLNRSVALKMLLADEFASALELTRLLREARAIAALRHPNIVQVYDVGDAAGRPFFTMELVDGGTLAQRIGGKPLPGRDSAALLVMLADATEAAHRAGIVHRDLKPANILLGADGTPKISDFGLARHVTDEQALHSNSVQIGTPSYMSPEQVRGTGDANSPLVDVYALGAVFYETLTGRAPFRGATSMEIYRQVLADEPVVPSNRSTPRRNRRQARRLSACRPDGFWRRSRRCRTTNAKSSP